MLVIVVLVIYLIAMLIIGIILSRKIDTTEDYFIGGRSLPWYLVIMTMAATYIGAGATLADTGLAYELGASEYIATIITMIAMALFGLVSPRISKIGFKYRIVSISGLISWRFGKWPGVFSALIILWALTGTLSGQVSGSATVLPIIFENAGIGNVTYEVAAVAMVVVMIVYTSMSGMFGVAWTDFIQCIILLIGMAFILPGMMLQEAGGFSNVIHSLPEGHLSFVPGSYILTLSFTYLCYFFAGPPYWQRAFSSESPETSRIGALGGVAIILFYSTMVLILGITAKVLVPELPEGMHSQGIVVYLMTQLLHPAITAIICAAIIAAIMSTMDSYLLTAVQAIMTDVIRPFKSFDEATEVKLSKVLVAVVGVLCLIIALYIKGILTILLMAWGFYSASMAASVVAAVFWNKATAPGCLASMFGGIGIYFFWSLVLNSPGGFSGTIVAALSSIAILIVVSLATYKTHPTPMFEGVGKHDAVVKTKPNGMLGNQL